MAFVEDTFTESSTILLENHTGETGASWTKHSLSGTNNIEVNSTLDGTSSGSSDNGTAAYYASGTPSTAEYDVEVTIERLGAASLNKTVGIYGRFDTSDHTGYLVRYYPNSDELRFHKVVTGTFTSLGTHSVTLATNEQMVVKLEIRDDAKKVYVDSSEVLSDTDNSITAAGRVGVQHNFSDTDDATLLDITATDAAAGGGGGLSIPVVMHHLRQQG